MLLNLMNELVNKWSPHLGDILETAHESIFALKRRALEQVLFYHCIDPLQSFGLVPSYMNGFLELFHRRSIQVCSNQNNLPVKTSAQDQAEKRLESG